MVAAREARLIIAPVFRSRMLGKTSKMHSIVPLKLISMACQKSSNRSADTILPCDTPALFTMMSTGPRVLVNDANVARTPGTSAMSHLYISTCTPSYFWHAAFVSSRFSMLRSSSARLAPVFASAIAIARPMPVGSHDNHVSKISTCCYLAPAFSCLNTWPFPEDNMIVVGCEWVYLFQHLLRQQPCPCWHQPAVLVGWARMAHVGEVMWRCQTHWGP